MPEQISKLPFPFPMGKEKTQESIKNSWVFSVRSPHPTENADEQSEWAREIICNKTHYLQMRNLYCQRNFCEAKKSWEYIKGP